METASGVTSENSLGQFLQGRKRVGVVRAEEDEEVLAKKGYDPQLGARPLRRAIQRLLEDPLSEKVLFKEFPAGSTVLVTVDEEDGSKLAFEAIETPAEPPVELAEN